MPGTSTSSTILSGDPRLAELLQHYIPGRPFPGATMRVGRATKVKQTLISTAPKDRALGL